MQNVGFVPRPFRCVTWNWHLSSSIATQSSSVLSLESARSGQHNLGTVKKTPNFGHQWPPLAYLVGHAINTPLPFAHSFTSCSCSLCPSLTSRCYPCDRLSQITQLLRVHKCFQVAWLLSNLMSAAFAHTFSDPTAALLCTRTLRPHSCSALLCSAVHAHPQPCSCCACMIENPVARSSVKTVSDWPHLTGTWVCMKTHLGQSGHFFVSKHSMSIQP